MPIVIPGIKETVPGTLSKVAWCAGLRAPEPTPESAKDPDALTTSLVGSSSETIVAAYGGFDRATGLPCVGWPICFKGDAAFTWPPNAFDIDESKPSIALWQGTGAAYDVENAKERPAWVTRVEFWLYGEEGMSEESLREWRADMAASGAKGAEG